MNELTMEEKKDLLQQIVLSDQGEIAIYFANVMELCVKGPEGLSSDELRSVMQRTAEIFNEIMKIQWNLNDRATH